MTNIKVLLLIVSIFLFFAVIGLNILIYKSIVRRAIKRSIKSYFIEEGYVITSQKYPGIFSSGAFKNSFLLGPFIMGWPYHNTYVDFYLISKDGRKKKTTVLISTLFLSIRKVKYMDYSD